MKHLTGLVVFMSMPCVAMYPETESFAQAHVSHNGLFLWMSDLNLDGYDAQPPSITIFKMPHAQTPGPRAQKSVPGRQAIFSPNGQLVAVLSDDTAHRSWVTLYNLSNLQPMSTPIPGDLADFSPDSTLLWITDRGNEQARCVITVFQTKNLQRLGEPVYGDLMIWSPDSTWALVRYWDSTEKSWLILYLVETMQPVAPAIAGHNAQFNPNGQFIWVKDLVHHFDTTGMIQLYAVPTMQPVSQRMPGVWAHFNPDGYSLSVCSSPEVRP